MFALSSSLEGMFTEEKKERKKEEEEEKKVLVSITARCARYTCVRLPVSIHEARQWMYAYSLDRVTEVPM